MSTSVENEGRETVTSDTTISKVMGQRPSPFAHSSHVSLQATAEPTVELRARRQRFGRPLGRRPARAPIAPPRGAGSTRAPHANMTPDRTTDTQTTDLQIQRQMAIHLAYCTVCVSVCLCACLPACLPVGLSARLQACLPACLHVCLSACLPVCLLPV